jgi:hypothetical protein
MKVSNYIATKCENFEKEQWWLNELESLGITTKGKKINEYNDLNEISSLTENIKQALYQKYKKVFI